MLNELKDFSNITPAIEEQNIFISKYTSINEDGTRDLFEAQFFRETCLAEEKQNSTLLSAALDKLIKAIAPLK
ncbi:MAG: hypothetical protein IKO19_07035 [Candidatus Riflebacteria bacterium]|nr:hypothetical protein [Candidatus Riflebacteria bacterium]MBR4570402.1 hypothetical protein [Candidatus Riflebacteria bacterium]